MRRNFLNLVLVSISVANTFAYCPSPSFTLNSFRSSLSKLPKAQQSLCRPSKLALRMQDKLDLFVTEHNKLHLESRLKYLEQQAVSDLTLAVSKYENPVFTTALIAGDDVILHILHKSGLLPKVKIVFIDTLHLFPETLEFLDKVEKFYGFKAVVYKAEGCQTREDFDEKYGDDIFIEDIEAYDKVAKVEPLLRALRESQTKLWINGRRRDQGFERAALQVWEREKMNPIAFWTFEDCWKYIEKEKVPYHPLHDDGYPSLGDMHSTLRVEKEKWFLYGMERAGRFQNMQNPDGSDKTECGIHTVSSPLAK